MMPPTLISIGTVLIDAFDDPPRPNVDCSPPSSGTLATVPAPPTPPSPTPPSPSGLHGNHVALPPRSSRHAPRPPPLHDSASQQALPPPFDSRSPPSPPISGTSTPQLAFGDSSPSTSHEYLGGGGLFAIIGGRIFLQPNEVCTLVDRAPGGIDLPPALEQQVNAFGEGVWVWNEGPDTRMIRARIKYEGDTRLFQHIVRPTHRTVTSLLHTPLQGGGYLHVSPPFSPQDLVILLDEIDSLDTKQVDGAWRPKVIFEPTPVSCHAVQKAYLEQVATRVHVLSPNHEELLSIYSYSPIPLTSHDLVPAIERIIRHLIHTVGIGQGGNGILVVRCGRMGACVGTRRGGVKWFPAYWGGGEESNVRDVTGAGNAFLGGYAAGLKLNNEDPYEAVLYGTVASSFVVQQVGLPSISKQPKGVNGRTNGDEHESQSVLEKWNGDDPLDRVYSLRAKWVAAGLL